MGSSDSFILPSITQNRRTIQGGQIWITLAKTGFNTSVSTPFYWQCCCPKDQMYIIQLGRPTRIGKIQFSEKRRS